MALGPITTIPTASWVTPAQYPFALYVNGNDVIANVQATSFWLDDPGGAPARFGFALEDPTGTLIANAGLATQTPPQQSPVIWYSAVQDRVLFHGWLKALKPVPHATWTTYAFECADRSEVLDFTPIIFEYRPAESDQVRIQALLRSVPFIQAPASVAQLSATLGSTVYQATTVRQAVTDILSAATGGDYYLDAYGRLATYSGTGGGAGPYNINNDAPNNSTTISAQILPETDGWSDVDGVYVIGGTTAGTGYVWGSVRRDPPRIAQISVDTSVDATTKAAAGAAELARRQNVQRLQIIVEGWDGWARGQVVSVTDSRLGWTAKPFVIQGVSMQVVTKSTASGTGLAFRRYTLTCGAYRRSLVNRLRAASTLLPTDGSDISGSISAGADVTANNNAIVVTDASNRNRVTMGQISATDYGLKVVSSDGSTVIIDGTSDIFKILATGTDTGSGADQTQTDLQVTTLTGLGTFATTPAHVSFVSPANNVGANQHLGFNAAGGTNNWAASVSGGATTSGIVGLNLVNYHKTNLNGSNQCVVYLTMLNHTGGSQTYFGRYYVLAETAL